MTIRLSGLPRIGAETLNGRAAPSPSADDPQVPGGRRVQQDRAATELCGIPSASHLPASRTCRQMVQEVSPFDYGPIPGGEYVTQCPINAIEGCLSEQP